MRLQTRLVLWLFGTLLTILIPLGVFTIREARQAARRTLEENIAARLGLLRAIADEVPAAISALAALAQEFGGYGYLLEGDRLRYSDTAERTLPEAVLEALTQGQAYRNLIGDTLYVALPSSWGGLGLAAPLAAVTTVTQRLLFAYALAATALLISVGLLARYLLKRLLTPLHQLAEAITQRHTDHLAPLPPTPLPEMQPVVARLNALLAQLEHSLARSRQQAEAARRFAAQASHELRTPLTALHGYLELLSRQPNSPRALDGALRQSKRLEALLESLLHLARVEGRGDLQLELFPLRPFIAARFPELSITGEACVMAEPALVELALHNLVRNAKLHGSPPIAISLSETPQQVCLTVRDSGPGFSKALLEHALEPFVHGERGGTGLGLAIVQAVMAAHGGSVRLANHPEGGAIVELRFRKASG